MRATPLNAESATLQIRHWMRSAWKEDSGMSRGVALAKILGLPKNWDTAEA